MTKINLKVDGNALNTTHFNAINPVCQVLFAVGSGGNPERHLPLLTFLSENNCSVIAPHFDRLVSPETSVDDLLLRAGNLKFALDHVFDPNLPVFGIGHSIGATLLLALAGGHLWMKNGERLVIPRDERIQKLVLFAPPTGYFQAPHALDSIQVPVQAWIGSRDAITPPEQIEFLRQSLSSRLPFDHRLVEGAGHFSFMNTLPPQVVDSIAKREDFLMWLGQEVLSFIRT